MSKSSAFSRRLFLPKGIFEKNSTPSKNSLDLTNWWWEMAINTGFINTFPCCTGYIPPMINNVTTGITAYAGGGQSNATALTTAYNRVDTVATAGDSVKLPAATKGQTIVVKNNTLTDVAVFPYTSGTIDTGSANTSITIPGGDTRVFIGTSSTNWETNQKVSSGNAGTAANPSFTFNTDSDTGIYSVGANDLGITAGGTLRFDISTTAVTSTLPLRNAAGSVSAPAYSYTGQTDMGAYKISSTQLGFSVAGTLQGGWSSSTGGLFTGSISEQTSGSGIKIKQATIQNYTTFAVNVSAPVSAANFNKGYFTSTSNSAVTLTLDTATNIGSQIGAAQGTTFDFYVDNTAGSSTVTVALNTGITAATPVITGGATLTVSTANGIGWFRLVFSSSTAAKLFRVG